jgi:hypothetical protein
MLYLKRTSLIRRLIQVEMSLSTVTPKCAAPDGEIKGPDYTGEVRPELKKSYHTIQQRELARIGDTQELS